MNITLPPDMEAYVQAKYRSGRYVTPAEVVCEGLRLLRDQDLLRAIRLEELQQEVTLGVQAIDEGSYVEPDSAYWDDLKQRVRRQRELSETGR